MGEHERENSEAAFSALEQKTASKTEQKRGNRLPGIAAWLFISLAASAVTLCVYDRWYAQKIVAVDLKGYITLQRYRYRDGKLTDEDLRRAFDRLGQLMDSVPKNRVVIMADTAIRNAEVFRLGHEEELKHYEERLRREMAGAPEYQGH